MCDEDFFCIFQKILFSAENETLRVNGHRIKLVHQDDNLTIYFLEDSELILEKSVWIEAAERIKAKDPWGDLLPPLEPKMSFGLRQVNAHLFGTIWRQTKHELQTRKAKDTAHFCYLPKEIGPCRRLEARFFFNSESGNCEPFAVRIETSRPWPLSFYTRGRRKVSNYGGAVTYF